VKGFEKAVNVKCWPGPGAKAHCGCQRYPVSTKEGCYPMSTWALLIANFDICHVEVRRLKLCKGANGAWVLNCPTNTSFSSLLIALYHLPSTSQEGGTTRRRRVHARCCPLLAGRRTGQPDNRASYVCNSVLSMSKVEWPRKVPKMTQRKKTNIMTKVFM